MLASPLYSLVFVLPLLYTLCLLPFVMCQTLTSTAISGTGINAQQEAERQQPLRASAAGRTAARSCPAGCARRSAGCSGCRRRPAAGADPAPPPSHTRPLPHQIAPAVSPNEGTASAWPAARAALHQQTGCCAHSLRAAGSAYSRPHLQIGPRLLELGCPTGQADAQAPQASSAQDGGRQQWKRVASNVEGLQAWQVRSLWQREAVQSAASGWEYGVCVHNPRGVSRPATRPFPAAAPAPAQTADMAVHQMQSQLTRQVQLGQ